VSGDVRNDAAGVLINACGDPEDVKRFVALLLSDAPPLAKIASIDTCPASTAIRTDGFHIVASEPGRARTRVAADAAVCATCREEVLDPSERRFRYPFANCTHCGPRLSILTRIPYDRPNTTMAAFTLCVACSAEYADPADRRFHAQPIGCSRCGPRARLESMNGAVVTYDGQSIRDDVDAARRMLEIGRIVAIKGLGGFHLACDATNQHAVNALRERKVREEKPFALMAPDIATIRRYCVVTAEEEALLESPAAPIVLLRADGPERLPAEVAPGMRTLGFMLVNTPLHVLLMQGMGRPIVMTSGNRSSEPQVTRDGDLHEKLGAIADYVLTHDRTIAARVDDSVARVIAGRPRVLRRARGYAPEPIALPSGFDGAPSILAFGAELKSTFCLLVDGEAVLSQHLGDLEDAATFAAYRANLALYEQLFAGAPAALAVDRHPEYLSTKHGRARAAREDLPLVEVQHHHAHVASVLAENGYPLAGPPVLGVALDGLGYGAGGELWGGEFLMADYRGYRRVGTFKPVALLGGAQAMREPWRNTYAHLMAGLGWSEFAASFAELELFAFLVDKPRVALDAMTARGLNSPCATSCGRLFDAVAAALGCARERATFEGQAAMLLETIVDEHAYATESEESAYPFSIARVDDSGLPYVEPLLMWRALLSDLLLGTPSGTIAARFQRGLERVVAAMAVQLRDEQYAGGAQLEAVALSGGCFQNARLLSGVTARLECAGFRVLTHANVPANDGGISLGQAAVAAATLLASEGRPL
jgi:hydrogenase maturation protein HypF